MLLLIFMICATITGVKGYSCSITEERELDDVCNISVVCDKTTSNLVDLLKSEWGCMSRFRDTHYIDYETYELNRGHILYVELTNVDINIWDDPFIGITDIKDNIITLNINKGNFVFVPTIIENLRKLTLFSLVYNEIEIINLSKLSVITSLQIVNVSHNYISTIEVQVDSGISQYSAISVLDLSYNAIESIPDNCFATFSNLMYLDLSYNMLTNFDILTFEGMTQLETLLLSNNKLFEIGQNFARFAKLKVLALDYNQLTSLTDFNFRTLISLEKLNLSANLVKNIEDRSLASLKKLEQLDLSHNKINEIHKKVFENNSKMYKLSLSHNYIQNIERGAFKSNNISYFDINNNYLSGSIEYDTFEGILVESLDLRGGKLTIIGERAFSSMSTELKYLNLSGNQLRNITQFAFQSLNMLLKLDLSCNELIDIDFDTYDLTQLTEYYLQNNKIKKIKSKVFRNMSILENLDLSNNKIQDIEFNSFIELTNLKTLNISNNTLDNPLTANIFQGLNSVKSLDLSNTRLALCLNESFSGMISLMFLNLSYSQIERIEYDTFKATGAIKIIDLSYNTLDIFNINTSSISQLSELYLSHNKLKNITSETFKQLKFLEKLTLGFNNILHIDSSDLHTLSHLRHLDLFSNSNLHIKSDIFNNLSLSQVSLKNVRKPFNFDNALNASIMTFILSHCDIDDINSVFIYKVKNILKLDLSSNTIKSVDKNSFRKMADLNWLDLSSNMISKIQPGSFLYTNMINNLNLYGNMLESLQFGTLDGLKNLRSLNLSSNAIHTFGVNLVHSSPHLIRLSLENNNLANIDLRGFSKTSVEVLSIGGNTIACDVLVNLKKYGNLFGNLTITAEILDFHTENIDGISCNTNFTQEISQNKINNITNEVIEIKETIGQLYGYLRISINDTFSKMMGLLENVVGYADKFSEKINVAQGDLNQHIKRLFEDDKNLLPQLLNTSDTVTNDIKSMKSLLEINNNLTNLGILLNKQLLNKTSIDLASKPENLSAVPQIYNIEPRVILDENVFSDVKMLLYFIAVCLAIIILFCILTLLHKYLFRKSSDRRHAYDLYESGQSIRNDIEME